MAKLPPGLTFEKGRGYRVRWVPQTLHPKQRRRAEFKQYLGKYCTKKEALEKFGDLKREDWEGRIWQRKGFLPSPENNAPQGYAQELSPEPQSYEMQPEIAELPEEDADLWTVGRYAEAYYFDVARAKNRPKTYETKKKSLTSWTAPWFWDIPLDDVTAHYVQVYQVERLDCGVKRATVNRGWAYVRHLLRDAYKRGYRASPPPQVEDLNEDLDRERPRFLNESECLEALEIANSRSLVYYAFTMFLLHTGGRLTESVLMEWSNIHFHDDPKKCRVHFPGDTAKRHRAREIPLLPELVDVLRRLPRRGKYVFVRPSASTGEWGLLARDGRDYGNKLYPWARSQDNYGAHVFRHTFSAFKLRGGVPIATLSRFLGHSSVKLTYERYGHIETGEHFDDMSKGSRISFYYGSQSEEE